MDSPLLTDSVHRRCGSAQRRAMGGKSRIESDVILQMIVSMAVAAALGKIGLMT